MWKINCTPKYNAIIICRLWLECDERRISSSNTHKDKRKKRQQEKAKWMRKKVNLQFNFVDWQLDEINRTLNLQYFIARRKKIVAFRWLCHTVKHAGFGSWSAVIQLQCDHYSLLSTLRCHLSLAVHFFVFHLKRKQICWRFICFRFLYVSFFLYTSVKAIKAMQQSFVFV